LMLIPRSNLLTVPRPVSQKRPRETQGTKLQSPLLSRQPYYNNGSSR
jgi:hypothetical protein